MAHTLKRGMFRFFLFTGCLFSATISSYAQSGKTNNATPPVTVPDTSKNNLLLPVMMQDSGKNGAVESLTLKECIDYAMQHQPALNRSLIGIDIAKTTNAIN